MVVNKGQKDTDVSRRTSEMPRRGLVGWFDAVRANQAGRLTLRIVVGVLGAILVGGGLLLVPLPGPGWLIVFAGLALLATEFAWAARALERGGLLGGEHRADRHARRCEEQHPTAPSRLA